MATRYTVRQGDCINSIAAEFGYHPDALWGHADNADLRKVRTSPDVLLEGDTVVLPDKVIKSYDRHTGARHTFRRKGVPAKLKLRVMAEFEGEVRAPAPFDPANPMVEGPRLASEEQKPLANADYRLTIDGVERTGKTDADGFIEVSIPPRATEGTLIIEPDTERERGVTIRLGQLDPVSTVSGVQQRLANLGYSPGAAGGEEGGAFARAVAHFQADQGLAVTGEIDAATTAHLTQAHGR